MTEPAPPPPRLTVRQAVLWGTALVIILVLVLLFFMNVKQLHPMLGARDGVWQTTWS